MMKAIFDETVEQPVGDRHREAQEALDALYKTIEAYTARKADQFALDEALSAYSYYSELAGYKLGFAQGMELARECAAIAG